MDHKFHEHFFSGETKAKLSDLISVRHGRDEHASDYFKRFKEIKNRCFSLMISEKDLADLAFNGLRSYLKEKLKGFEYHTVNYLQIKVLGLEFKLKNAKDTHVPIPPHWSNTHVLDHDSDSLDDESCDIPKNSLKLNHALK